MLEATSHKKAVVQLRPFISKTIQIEQTRHMENCWRSKDQLIREALLGILSHGHASVGRLTRVYQKQLRVDREYSLTDLTEPIDNNNEWRKNQ